MRVAVSFFMCVCVFFFSRKMFVARVVSVFFFVFYGIMLNNFTLQMEPSFMSCVCVRTRVPRPCFGQSDYSVAGRGHAALGGVRAGVRCEKISIYMQEDHSSRI